MKKTMTQYDIAEELMNDINANWSRAGAFALAEYFEQLEDDLGESIEFDHVAIRCDFSEHESLIDWATGYFSQWRADLSIDEDFEEDLDLEEIELIIREHIQDNGQLIEFDGGIIVSSF